MEIAILILSVIMVCISVACLFYTMKISKKVEDTKDNRANEKKLDEMSLELESIKKELELSRAENSELHEKLDEVLKK